MSLSILNCEDLTTGYTCSKSDKFVHKRLNFEVKKGQLVGLLGPNGSGKSTLLRTVCQLQNKLEGKIYILGKEIGTLDSNQRAKTIAVVLTNQISDQFLNVYEFLSLGRYPYTGWSGYLSASDHFVINEVLDLLHLQGFASRNMNELSDGERQRVLIARALIQEPQLVLLDEPTSFLDLPNKVELMHLLWRLSRERGISFLFSTHDLEIALKVCDQILLLHQGKQGGEYFCSSPESLIEEGVVSRVFSSKGLHFNPMNASFEINQEVQQYIQVDLDNSTELERNLILMALKRLGFEINDKADLKLFSASNPREYQLTKSSQLLNSCKELGKLIEILHQKSNDFGSISTKINK